MRVSTVIWPVVALLIGVLAGGYIANRNQKKQWLADSQKQEYRELLSTLTTAATVLIDYYQTGNATHTPAEREQTFKVYADALRILQDRIFIAKAIKESKIYDRWTVAMQDLSAMEDVDKFSDKFEEIREAIIELATKGHL